MELIYVTIALNETNLRSGEVGLIIIIFLMIHKISYNKVKGSTGGVEIRYCIIHISYINIHTYVYVYVHIRVYIYRNMHI